MTLNWIVGLIAVGLWSVAYGGYFQYDIRGWWWRYKHRRQLALIRHAQAYDDVIRRSTPMRNQPWTPPTIPVPDPPATVTEL